MDLGTPLILTNLKVLLPDWKYFSDTSLKPLDCDSIALKYSDRSIRTKELPLIYELPSRLNTVSKNSSNDMQIFIFWRARLWFCSCSGLSSSDLEEKSKRREHLSFESSRSNSILRWPFMVSLCSWFEVSPPIDWNYLI